MLDLTPRGSDSSERDLADRLAVALASMDKGSLQDVIDLATETMLDEQKNGTVRAWAAIIAVSLRNVQLGASFGDVRRLLEPLIRKGPTP
jgi:hypothetical protein